MNVHNFFWSVRICLPTPTQTSIAEIKLGPQSLKPKHDCDFFPSSKESHNSTYFFFTNPITLMMNKLFICVYTQKFLQRANTADDIMPGIPLLFFLLIAKWAVSHVSSFFFRFHSHLFKGRVIKLL